MPAPHASHHGALGARLKRFVDLERRDRLLGRHRAVDDLHRRPPDEPGAAERGGRLRQFLRIERGHSA